MNSTVTPPSLSSYDTSSLPPQLHRCKSFSHQNTSSVRRPRLTLELLPLRIQATLTLLLSRVLMLVYLISSKTSTILKNDLVLTNPQTPKQVYRSTYLSKDSSFTPTSAHTAKYHFNNLIWVDATVIADIPHENTITCPSCWN